MKTKINSIVIAVVMTVACVAAWAQNGINSPYSQFGIGEIKSPYNNPYTNAMAGLSYTVRNNFAINSNNPASYTAIDTQSFVFDFGLVFDFERLTDNNQTYRDANGNLSHIAIGFPITRWWKTSIGLVPWSELNYKTTLVIPDTSFGNVTTVFDGSGGINKIYWGHAFSITPTLSAGFNANFLFGNINRAITYHFDSIYALSSRKQKETVVRNFSLDFGLQYILPLANENSMTFGLTYSCPFKLNVDDKATIYTFSTKSGTEYIADTVFPTESYVSSLELPSVVGLGVAFNKADKWTVGLDLTYSQWNGAKYTENTTKNIFGDWNAIEYDNNYRMALGFERRSDRSGNKYYQLMSYHAGIHYEIGKSNINIAGERSRIDDFGIHAGVSFPVRKMKSFVNLSVQYGSYGTPDLVRKQYVQIGLSLSTSDTWFKKRKYE
ncbi:MAG: hypothetical protein IKQ94_02970 [Bacteroidales bacterium]|nr:hypothetical protein [Bacteroidales bacterium]